MLTPLVQRLLHEATTPPSQRRNKASFGRIKSLCYPNFGLGKNDWRYLETKALAHMKQTKFNF